MCTEERRENTARKLGMVCMQQKEAQGVAAGWGRGAVWERSLLRNWPLASESYENGAGKTAPKGNGL
jgi:hypothetical protein